MEGYYIFALGREEGIEPSGISQGAQEKQNQQDIYRRNTERDL